MNPQPSVLNEGNYDPLAMDVGDFDGDGQSDILASFDGGYVYLYTSISISGPAASATKTTFTRRVDRILATDSNNDGKDNTMIELT